MAVQPASAVPGRRAWLAVLAVLFTVLTGCERQVPLGELGPGQSALWGEDGERWSPTSRLPDFSWAGYRAGEEPIPDVPVRSNVKDFGAIGDGVTDDSQAFLDAIAATSDGAIFIPAGRYKITKVLRIEKSRLVLRGAGRDETVLFFPRSLYQALGRGKFGGRFGYTWRGGWIWVRGGYDEGPVLASIASAAKRGDDYLDLTSSEGIESGQMVRLAMYESDGSLSSHLHADHEFAGRCMIARAGHKSVDWVARVARVKGRRVYLDRPLRVDVRPEWNPEIRPYLPLVEEVGVEHLTVEFPDVEYYGHHLEPGYNGILFWMTYNSWVRDVRIVNFDTALFFWYAKYNTGRQIVLSGRRGHYGFHLGGAQDSLLTEFTIENESVHSLSFSNMSNGSVFSRGRGPNVNFDFHRGAPYENLFTDIDVGDAWVEGLRIWEQSGSRTGHQTGARETFWNIQPRIGSARVPRFPQINLVGRVRAPKKTRLDKLRDPWIEPVRRLRPENLHRAQLERRLGRALPATQALPQRAPEEASDQ